MAPARKKRTASRPPSPPRAGLSEVGTNSNGIVDEQWLRQHRRSLFSEARAVTKSIEHAVSPDDKPKRLQSAVTAVRRGLHVIIQKKNVLDAFEESLKESRCASDVEHQSDIRVDEVHDAPPDDKLLTSQVTELSKTLQELSSVQGVSDLVGNIVASSQKVADLLRHLHESSARLVEGSRELDLEREAQAEKIRILTAQIDTFLNSMKNALRLSQESRPEDVAAQGANRSTRTWLDPPAHSLRALGIIEGASGTLSRIAQEIDCRHSASQHKLLAESLDVQRREGYEIPVAKHHRSSLPAFEADCFIDLQKSDTREEPDVLDTFHFEGKGSGDMTPTPYQMEELVNDAGCRSLDLLLESADLGEPSQVIPCVACTTPGVAKLTTPQTTSATVQHVDPMETFAIASATPGIASVFPSLPAIVEPHTTLAETANAVPTVPIDIDCTFLGHEILEHADTLTGNARPEGKDLQNMALMSGTKTCAWTPMPLLSEGSANDDVVDETDCMFEVWQLDPRNLPKACPTAQRIEMRPASHRPGVGMAFAPSADVRWASAAASPIPGRPLSGRRTPPTDIKASPGPTTARDVNMAPSKRLSLPLLDLPSLVGRSAATPPLVPRRRSFCQPTPPIGRMNDVTARPRTVQQPMQGSEGAKQRQLSPRLGCVMPPISTAKNIAAARVSS